MGDNPITPTIDEDENITFLYFTYPHSTKTVEIQGTEAIPEFFLLDPLTTIDGGVDGDCSRLRSKNKTLTPSLFVIK